MTRPPAVLLNGAAPWDGPDPVEVATRATAAGLDGVGLVDSPRLFRDGLVETARVLAATPARLAGPCVASLGLRQPATVAGALRTLEEHAPGRVFAVLGRGESSVRNEGLPLPSLAEYTAALAAGWLAPVLAGAGLTTSPDSAATTLAAVLGTGPVRPPRPPEPAPAAGDTPVSELLAALG